MSFIMGLSGAVIPFIDPRPSYIDPSGNVNIGYVGEQTAFNPLVRKTWIKSRKGCNR